nr:alpha-2,8-sialyltransferase 8E-like [Lytechinus pictus]
MMSMSRQLRRCGNILKLAIIVCTIAYCVLFCSLSMRNKHVVGDVGRSDQGVIIDEGQAMPQFDLKFVNVQVKTKSRRNDGDRNKSEDIGKDETDGRLDLRLKPGSKTDMESVIRRLNTSLTSWRFRHDNLMRLRKQIKHFLGRDFLDSAFLTRDNTPLNSSVLFYKILPEGMVPVVHDLWVQLPKVPVYSGRQYKTCSVVGSSGILKGGKCGKFIDSSDFVFRMNNAPTSDNFVVDVGNRTNQMSETGKSLFKSSLNKSVLHTLNEPTTFNLTCLPSSPFPDELFQNASKPLPRIILLRLPTYPETELTRLITRGCRVVPEKEGNLVLWDSRINPKLNDFWKENGLKFKMSSGFFSVNLALHLCQEIRVFGFWPFRLSPDHHPVAYHYYDRLITKKIIHDFNEEFDILMRLHENGVIKLHVEDCSEK